jgi:hypothetical protein
MNSKAKACGSGVRAEQGFGPLPPVFIRYADLGDVLSRTRAVPTHRITTA